MEEVEFEVGRKYVIGDRYAGSWSYEQISGRVGILQSMDDFYTVLVEGTDGYGWGTGLWSVQADDLLPYVPESNEECLYLLKGDL